jgi:Neocarzinostatin family
MPHRQLLTVGAACALVLAWATPALSSAAQTPSTPTLTVTPDTGLVDGQSVLIEGAGFTPGELVVILQCLPGSSSVSELLTRCVTTGAVPTPNASGSFSTFQAVRRTIEPRSGGPIDCGASPGACTIAATHMNGPWAEAAIAFEDGSSPTPTIDVKPSVDLKAGDVVTVTGAGFSTSETVTIIQCQSDRPASDEWCDVGTGVNSTTDEAGGFVTQVGIQRGITLPSGAVIDCAPRACVIAAFTADGPHAQADIDLTSWFVLAAAESGLLSQGGTVDLQGAFLCTPPTAVGLEIRGVISQLHDDRVILAEFRLADSCRFFDNWTVRVPGSRSQRFKVGTARIAAWAYDIADPVPEDATKTTTDIEIVRAPR